MTKTTINDRCQCQDSACTSATYHEYGACQRDATITIETESQYGNASHKSVPSTVCDKCAEYQVKYSYHRVAE